MGLGLKTAQMALGIFNGYGDGLFGPAAYVEKDSARLVVAGISGYVGYLVSRNRQERRGSKALAERRRFFVPAP